MHAQRSLLLLENPLPCPMPVFSWPSDCFASGKAFPKGSEVPGMQSLATHRGLQQSRRQPMLGGFLGRSFQVGIF